MGLEKLAAYLESLEMPDFENPETITEKQLRDFTVTLMMGLAMSGDQFPGGVPEDGAVAREQVYQFLKAYWIDGDENAEKPAWLTNYEVGDESSTGRRGNHESSLHQRSDGRWCGQVSLADGQRKYVYGKTREEVSQVLNRYWIDGDENAEKPAWLTNYEVGDESSTGRRGNYESSLHQRSDGRWCGHVSLADGQRKYVYGKTREEVSQVLNRYWIDGDDDAEKPAWLTNYEVGDE